MDVFSRFQATKSTKNVSEALEKQHTLDKQKERKSDPAWKNHSEPTKRRGIVENEAQIELEIVQHLVDKLDFTFLMMHLLNHFSDHICCGETTKLEGREPTITLHRTSPGFPKGIGEKEQFSLREGRNRVRGFDTT